MSKIGCSILTLWLAMNLLPSAWILTQTLSERGHTPALYLLLSPEQVDALDADTLATLDSIAVFANGMNIAFCIAGLFLVWLGLARRQEWAFWALAAGFSAALFAGTAADYMVGLAAPWVNVVSALILAAGLVCARIGLRTGVVTVVPVAGEGSE